MNVRLPKQTSQNMHLLASQQGASRICHRPLRIDLRNHWGGVHIVDNTAVLYAWRASRRWHSGSDWCVLVTRAETINRVVIGYLSFNFYGKRANKR